MDLVTLARNNPDAFEKKTIDQIVAITDDGKLHDGSECARQVREFLKFQNADRIAKYANYCLKHPSELNNAALQDIVNEIGRRLEFDVVYGKYFGSRQPEGYDGLWASGPNQLVIVCKIADDYKVDIDGLMHNFEDGPQAEKTGMSFAGLIVVGQQETWDLERQIRGGRYAASVRVVSIQSLLKLLLIHDKQPKRVAKITSLLLPHDFTRLDHLVGDYCELFEEAGQGTAQAQTSSPAPAAEAQKRAR
jgi:hypothetical protein